MPESRYVSSARLMILLRYVAGAVVVLVLATLALGWLGDAPGLRRAVVVGWLLAFPLGLWIVWRRSVSRDH